MSELSPDLSVAFSEFGLLHVLALSGQHVVILVFVVGLLLRPGLLFIPQLGGVVRNGPLLAISVLLFTSLFTASVVRVAGMAVVLFLTQSRCLVIAPLRLIILNTLFSVGIWPELMSDRGFWLSTIGVANLVTFRQSTLGGLIQLVIMPFVMTPIVAHFFGVISFVSPVASPIIGPLWEWFVMPCGFILPFLPEPVMAAASNVLGEFFFRLSSLGDGGSRWLIATIRPTTLELIAMTLCIGSLWQLTVKWRGRH